MAQFKLNKIRSNRKKEAFENSNALNNCKLYCFFT